MIDYSGFKHAKSRPKALEREEKRHAVALTDAKENAKARKRAKGQCEVRCEVRMEIGTEGHEVHVFRCLEVDAETHHLIGGIGRRNRGKSILADYKLRVCRKHHQMITWNILRPTTANHDAHNVRYWQAR